MTGNCTCPAGLYGVECNKSKELSYHTVRIFTQNHVNWRPDPIDSCSLVRGRQAILFGELDANLDYHFYFQNPLFQHFLLFFSLRFDNNSAQIYQGDSFQMLCNSHIPTLLTLVLCYFL